MNAGLRDLPRALILGTDRKWHLLEPDTEPQASRCRAPLQRPPEIRARLFLSGGNICLECEAAWNRRLVEASPPEPAHVARRPSDEPF